MLEKFGQALKNTLSKIAGSIFIDKSLIDQISKELKRAMIEADIPLDITNTLIEKIEKQASKDQKGVEKREQILKLIHDELTNILGKEEHKFKPDKKSKPYKIMLAGLYGSGKTTTVSKLALYYSKRGFKTCILGLDVHRPAAPEQLQQLAEKIKIPAFIDKDEKNVLAIYEKFKSKIKQYDLCIVDTAGRDALSKDLINEIKLLKSEIKPEQTFLVIAADIGQAARQQAKTFKEIGITGVIVTRLDGTAKGGGALASCAETNANVVFIGTGEKVHDIETFDPSSFVSRLLGMGDLKALMDKIKTIAEEQQQEKIEKIKEGKLTLTDFCDQIKTMQKMGSMDKVAEMIPGLGNLGIPKNMPDLFKVQEEKIARWRFAIESMTKKEKENPETIDSNRVSRISKGSHVPANEIREMLKQYKLVQEFSQTKNQQFDQRFMQKIAKKFGKKLF